MDRSCPTFKNYVIYAVDGWQFTLPRTESVVQAGYTGRAVSHLKESYMPKGFLTHAYDVLSETTINYDLNSSSTELVDALSFISNFEPNSITLYDRGFFAKRFAWSIFQLETHLSQDVNLEKIKWYQSFLAISIKLKQVCTMKLLKVKRKFGS